MELLDCFKDFRSIKNTGNICQGEGFMEVEFLYLGGRLVLLDFDSNETKDRFMNQEGIKSWFYDMKVWQDDSHVMKELFEFK